MPDPDVVTVEVELAGCPQDVYTYWVDPDLYTQWMGRPVASIRFPAASTSSSEYLHTEYNLRKEMLR